MDDAAERVPVVALVSSAGGLAATSAILADLPADLRAAVIVLQHGPPDHESLLAQILARRTDLRVAVAVDGAPLEPGTVLVAPPGQHTLVTGARRVLLIESGAFPPSRPSADLLLTTLAIAVGPAAMAVILSGGGHDGTTGATAVHRLGGAVIATDKATSQNFSMPSAAIGRDAIVDAVVPLPDAARWLIDRLSSPTPGPGSVRPA